MSRAVKVVCWSVGAVAVMAVLAGGLLLMGNARMEAWRGALGARFSKGPRNLLANPGFEDGMGGWKNAGQGSAAVVAAGPGARALSGRHFAELSSGPGQKPSLYAADSAGKIKFFPVKPGDVVTWGAWVSRVSGTGAAQCGIGIYGPNGSDPVFMPPKPGNVTASAWTLQQGSYTMRPWRSSVTFYCLLGSGRSASAARFDGAFLRVREGRDGDWQPKPLPATLSVAGAPANARQAVRSSTATPASAQAAREVAATIEWVRFESGGFMMGSEVSSNERPVHRVSVGPFEMAKSPVTFKQYRACVAAGACNPPHVSDGSCLINWENEYIPAVLSDAFQGDSQPVICIDWDEANAFARWVGARLPTEAEWEFAARGAGQDRKYPWGDGEATCDKAIFRQDLAGCGRNATWPVCSKPTGNTMQGLCDMAGNVWTWTQDWSHDSYSGAPTDGTAWTSPVSSVRVIRGGSWVYEADCLRATFRAYNVPAGRGASLGVRLAR